MTSRKYDWKTSYNKGWPYKGDVNNPKYIKDRSKLFEENGNGWWIYQGYTLRKHTIIVKEGNNDSSKQS